MKFLKKIGGGNFVTNPIPKNCQFVFEGDSLTRGSAMASGNTYPEQVVARPAFSGRGVLTNLGLNGDTLSGIAASYASTVYPLRPAATSSDKSFLFVWIGANDYFAATPATYMTSLKSYWSTAKADGFVVVAFTIMGRSLATNAQEDNRRAINRLIREASEWDYLIDVDELLPDCLNTSWFADGTHCTAAGYARIADHVENVIIAGGGLNTEIQNRFLGARFGSVSDCAFGVNSGLGVYFLNSLGGRVGITAGNGRFGLVQDATGAVELRDGGTLGVASVSAHARTLHGTDGVTTLNWQSRQLAVGAWFMTGGPLVLKAYTVATLPTGIEGGIAYVTDAVSPTYLGTLTGGGTTKVPVFYNGAAWVAH